MQKYTFPIEYGFIGKKIGKKKCLVPVCASKRFSLYYSLKS